MFIAGVAIIECIFEKISTPVSDLSLYVGIIEFIFANDVKMQTKDKAGMFVKQ